MAGWFTGTVSFGSTSLTSAGGTGDAFVAKFNSSGDNVWAIRVGTGTDRQVEQATSLAVDGNGNLFASLFFVKTVSVGTTSFTSAGETDVLIMKLSASTGGDIWVKQFGSINSDFVHSISLSPTGELYFSGAYFTSTTFGAVTLNAIDQLDAFVGKLNGAGDLLWLKPISGQGWENALGVTSDLNGNCVVTGYLSGNASIGNTSFNSSAVNEDIFIAKLNSAGDVSWAKTTGGTNLDEGRGVATDGNGNIYVSGWFGNNVNFGNQALVSNSSTTDIFVSKLNPSGEFLWTKQAGSAGNDWGWNIAVDPANTIHATGSFSQNITFGTTPVTAGGGTDIFLWKIRQ